MTRQPRTRYLDGHGSGETIVVDSWPAGGYTLFTTSHWRATNFACGSSDVIRTPLVRENNGSASSDLSCDKGLCPTPGSRNSFGHIFAEGASATLLGAKTRYTNWLVNGVG
ncbi:hypothetical protein TNCV_1914361 [Trichonephila clavipes]|nr:hypothetical protein TNCV_1914361 [Trichonephila clavipes]